MEDTIEIRSIDSLEEQRAAAELYRSVFGYTERSLAVNPRLLRSLRDNGGSAIGAFDGDGKVLGFCYGFTATAGGRNYHYSQATVIDPASQGGGIGRALKLEQGRVARDTGVDTMRWSYDPQLAHNGHFNLSVLGARGRWFHPDYYGEPDTDRLVVEWQLDPVARAERAERHAAIRDSIRRDFAETVSGNEQAETATGVVGALRWLAFDVKPVGDAARVRVRNSLRNYIAEACHDGFAAVLCDSVGNVADGRNPQRERAVYVFGRD